jgi:hypothetical protein
MPSTNLATDKMRSIGKDSPTGAAALSAGEMRWTWEQSAALRELRSTKAHNV